MRGRVSEIIISAGTLGVRDCDHGVSLRSRGQSGSTAISKSVHYNTCTWTGRLLHIKMLENLLIVYLFKEKNNDVP